MTLFPLPADATVRERWQHHFLLTVAAFCLVLTTLQTAMLLTQGKMQTPVLLLFPILFAVVLAFLHDGRLRWASWIMMGGGWLMLAQFAALNAAIEAARAGAPSHPSVAMPGGVSPAIGSWWRPRNTGTWSFPTWSPSGASIPARKPALQILTDCRLHPWPC